MTAATDYLFGHGIDSILRLTNSVTKLLKSLGSFLDTGLKRTGLWWDFQ